MNPRRRGGVGPSALAAARDRLKVAILFLLALSAGCDRETAPSTPVTVYHNPVRGYSVSYPDTMDLREYTPDDISIGYAAGDGFDARVELVFATGESGSFDELVEKSARDACAADGPGISLRCTRVEPRGTVRSESGRRGEILHLTMERAEVQGGPAVEVLERGPFVAFDLSEDDGPPAVLFVRAPVTLNIWETDADLVLQVARSLELEEGGR